MRELLWVAFFLLLGCQPFPRGIALCTRTPRYAELAASALAVSRVCVDDSAIVGFGGKVVVAQVLANAGLSLAVDAQCDWRLVLTLAPPPALGGSADAVWSAGAASPERHAVRSELIGNQAVSTIYAETDRGAVYGVRAAVAALTAAAGDSERNVFASGTLVDYPSFPLRGVVESIYGKAYSVAEQQTTLQLMSCMGENLYIYGQKDTDLYTHYRWAEPYPAQQAAALRNAAVTAAENLIPFVWGISPGWWGGADFIKDSICYSCDDDFARLTSKTEAMRALGISRFALLLDDLAPTLPWAVDAAKFGTLAKAHAFLINRWDDYLMATGAREHLLVVGAKYTSDDQDQVSGTGWQFYNHELGAAVHAGVQIFWTGPAVFSAHIATADLEPINQLLARKVLIWSNWPRTVAPLDGLAVELPTAAGGLFSCPVINQNRAHPVSDFWPVLGTAADYAWRPESYVPEESFARWQQRLAAILH